MKLVTQLQQVPLSHAFIVDKLHSVSCTRHTLDFHPVSAPNTDVDILAAGADSGSHAASTSCGQAAKQNGITHLFGRSQVRARDRLGQWHAQSIGAPGHAMPFVMDLAARILFHADVSDREFAPSERQVSIDTYDGGAL